MLDITRGRSLAGGFTMGRPGDDASPSAAPTPQPDACPCNGSGAYTVTIPLADAIVSDRRLCLDHGLTPRARLLDTTTGRTGELMEVTGQGDLRRAWLRPVAGGTEWSTSVGSLRPHTP
jgi:hypothetical protein